MLITLDAPKRFDLCSDIVTASDHHRRAKAIAHMRSEIRREQQVPHSPEDQTYLRVAEMVLDFLEERLDSRSADVSHHAQL
jgi:hypothetical protein